MEKGKKNQKQKKKKEEDDGDDERNVQEGMNTAGRHHENDRDTP